MVLAIILVAMTGCEDALSRDSTVSLREQIIAAQRRQIEAAGTAQKRITTPGLSDSYLEKEPQRVENLDRISGPRYHRDQPLEHGLGLDGEPSGVAAMSLQQALRTGLRNNLDVQIASLQPAISEAQVAEAEAAFDATYFLNTQYQKVNHPQQVVLSTDPTDPTKTTAVTSPTKRANTANLTTGIKKPLETGGQITLSTGLDYNDDQSPSLALSPNPAWTSNVLLAIQQPLLRNFGGEVTRATITVRKNAQRRDALRLKAQLLTTLADIEEAYWNLVFSRHNLAIQQDLTRMTIEARDIVFARGELDVTAVQRAQAQSFVERRRGDLITARKNVRTASDRLKRLLNDPALPLSDETLVVPIDDPVTVPIEFNLLDTVTTAMRDRPETLAALLDIDDASVRQAVADNQRLPDLTLNAQLQLFGLNSEDKHLPNSYTHLAEDGFLEYLVGGQFEMPIGNRAAEAVYRRTRIEGQSSVLTYKKAAQDAVFSVKDALHEVEAAYSAIGITRSERLVAAENVRAINARQNVVEGLSPEFLLDQKLNAQDRLADAERREVEAMVTYNIAVMRVRQARGTLLEDNQVQMAWPPGMFDERKKKK